MRKLRSVLLEDRVGTCALAPLPFPGASARPSRLTLLGERRGAGDGRESKLPVIAMLFLQVREGKAFL